MITGSTKLYAIVADPIAQVKTPEVLNSYFAKQNMDAVLVPVHVDVNGLAAVFTAFRSMKNLGGVIVTVPHKTVAAQLCDDLGPAGRAIGSVNVIRRMPDGSLLGDTFDGAGFVSGLCRQGHDPKGKRALLVGSGGAAGAIAFSLAQAGVASLTIANRTRAKAQDIVDRVAAVFPQVTLLVGAADPTGHDLVINATSLGMQASDPLPLDVSRLTPGMVVAEIIMKPEQTPLLLAAQDKGCFVHYGKHMLEQQVNLIAQFMLDTD
ncbi:shikimate dehydrogenase [Alcaligenaceae bacterium]|nr:shikimate dehydrogenase [Alcaligenaceae bacterium]